MHSSVGTISGGCRVPNYHALYAGQPENIHVLTFDYQGFGHSTGKLSEAGLILDAITIINWAMSIAGIPASYILIFGHLLGTIVSVAVSSHFAL
jgi:abhydrolase domain-containing protein 12